MTTVLAGDVARDHRARAHDCLLAHLDPRK